MKTCRYPLILLILFICKGSRTQTLPYDYILDVNNIKTTLDATGTIGYGYSHPNYFYAPATGLVSPVVGTWLWLVGIDQDGLYRDLAPNWYFNPEEIKIGPYTEKFDGFDNNITELIINKYNRVWKITAEQIEDHKNNFYSPDYQMPEAIINWPGNGDTTYGASEMLAPFVDYNANKFYEPGSGDHPVIKGDVAIYAIYNDHGDYDELSTNPRSDLEVHVMLYGYYSELNSALGNTVFVNYKIINRGDRNYSNLFAGIFSSFDLGAYDDDYVGCDSSLNLFYVYNGDMVDGPTPINYGDQLPAFGCTSLTNDLHAFMYRNSDFSVLGYPITAEQTWLCMDAKFRDGVQMTYGGNGYDSSPDAIETNFMFSGNPRNLDEWSEVSESNPPADRRVYGSTGPYNLNAGDELCAEFAYIFAQPETPNDNIDGVDLLKNFTSQIQAIYPFLEEEKCLEYKTATLPDIISNETYHIYPNPSGGIIIIQSGLPEKTVFYANIFNMNGQRLKNYTFVNSADDQAHHIDISTFSSGLYILRFEINGREFSEKIIVK
ncbi:MAG: T9SS type A sorting domain-containing protein [Chitinophagales bacterium]